MDDKNKKNLNTGAKSPAGAIKKTSSTKFSPEKKHRSQLSEYGTQMREKQNIKKTYGVSEKQFRNYVVQAEKLASHSKVTPALEIYQSLEKRLDNVVFRMGLAKTRPFARQMVNHGHILVNGKKLDIPSHKIRISDVISVREGSKATKLFSDYIERLKDLVTPNWLEIEPNKLSAKVTAFPKEIEAGFDFAKVLEFYNK